MRFPFFRMKNAKNQSLHTQHTRLSVRIKLHSRTRQPVYAAKRHKSIYTPMHDARRQRNGYCTVYTRTHVTIHSARSIARSPNFLRCVKNALRLECMHDVFNDTALARMNLLFQSLRLRNEKDWCTRRYTHNEGINFHLVGTNWPLILVPEPVISVIEKYRIQLINVEHTLATLASIAQPRRQARESDTKNGIIYYRIKMII